MNKISKISKTDNFKFLEFIRELWNGFFSNDTSKDSDISISETELKYRKYYIKLLDLNLLARKSIKKHEDANAFASTISKITAIMKDINTGYSETLPLFDKIVEEYLNNTLVAFTKSNQEDSKEFLKSLSSIDAKIVEMKVRIKENDKDELNRLVNVITEMTKTGEKK